LAAIPLKPEYGPTLGRLLAPRWHAASRLARAAVVALAVGMLALAIGVGLTLENAHYSYGGSVPFHLSYRGLYRVRPEAGAFVTLHQRSAEGQLRYSYSVSPIELGAYSIEPSAELALFAAHYQQALATRTPGFVLRGEGKTKISSNVAPGYEILYTATLEGRAFYGRNVLLLPEVSGAPQGVAIAMLTAAGASKQVRGPAEVATTGVLQLPLKSFSFG
jgi:hypothetical protein